MYILGINLSHDRSACLLKDGKIAFAVAEERLDGIKKSTLSTAVRKQGMSGRIPPLRAIDYCLQAEGISIDDLDLVVADHAVEPVNIESLKTLLPIKDKSKIRAIPHPSHHLAHAYSSYFCSPFEESAVLIIDVYGSATGNGTEAESGFHAQRIQMAPVFKNFQALWNEKHPDEKAYYSLTYTYNFVTLALGFTIANEKVTTGSMVSEAGKTMGLASYGGPLGDSTGYIVFGEKHLETGGFTRWALDRKIGKVVDGQLVPRVKPKRFKLNKFHRDLAYTVQAEFENGVLFLARRLYEITGSKNLCIAGGGGLNSIVNKKILDETPFENIFVQPAATDDGNAIGCALYGWHALSGQEDRYRMNHAFLGRSYRTEIPALLQKHQLKREPLAKAELVKRAAQYLAEGKIVGWFQGGSEFGPRALGHRSILADPRRAEMKDIMNEKIKHRESFRPYAPSVLLEHSREYFDLSVPSPYMLLVADVLDSKTDVIPAVVHVDGTARVQTVTQKDNGIFYDLIQEFQRLTGVPVIFNTSFNDQGMPIVETPADALDKFLDSLLDVLVLEGTILDKEESDTLAAQVEHFDRKGKAQKAMEIAQIGLERFPRDERFLARLASWHFEKEEFLEAAQACESVLQSHPADGNQHLHRILGISYTRLGEFAKAVPELQQAGIHDPDDEAINFSLARCYRELKQVEMMNEETEKGTSKMMHKLRGF